jgi:hypothetical protein
MLSEAELQKIAPAVFTEGHLMSPRYAQIATISLVRALAKAGYRPVQAEQDRPTRRDPAFVTHSVVLRHEDHINQPSVVGEAVPQILLLNSNNGRTQLRIRAGLYRFVCANSLVIGESAAALSMPHRGDAVAEALGFADAMSRQATNIGAMIEKWTKVQLNHHQRNAFAREAAVLRYGQYSAKNFEVRDLLTPRRAEDDTGTLWATFNVVQENTVKGGVRGINPTGRGTTSRPLNAIIPNAQYNARLWDLANRYAETAA